MTAVVYFGEMLVAVSARNPAVSNFAAIRELWRCAVRRGRRCVVPCRIEAPKGGGISSSHLCRGGTEEAAPQRSSAGGSDLQMGNRAIDRYVVEAAVGQHAEIGHVVEHVGRSGPAGKLDVQEIGATHVAEPERGAR